MPNQAGPQEGACLHSLAHLKGDVVCRHSDLHNCAILLSDVQAGRAVWVGHLVAIPGIHGTRQPCTCTILFPRTSHVALPHRHLQAQLVLTSGESAIPAPLYKQALMLKIWDSGQCGQCCICCLRLSKFNRAQQGMPCILSRCAEARAH